ncbi:undecaprenyl/decaprenyl-phosphate alpha-N-acetylglucosaminyl 1-phosphate transferase [Elizabethkingia meningoseptica]|uniref:glycosyltransferase family 4 protein n=1 Tax=Elizabethkingia meningoseptica TaxID=238 RepID=UPI0022F17F05|nr:MraY family glycosyltransferase [Elizabethkingia meningoseptica]EJK5329684.1 undecaprenyl/decaprenyl-phosphate alpha-N-acetylglucosaminyl 1-phosphate transferase [Elizabethkingia meningoseptica]MDE5430883.1 undecaprenyl/decaprenyl-phosphate alpha-N-acetylglucosaminyl 1-phosphate transferase [Elizabethkingia meningoseptica]MDE5468039.1 undecaprenyl/decaprenyl-phosphate alpha-N-acetylglucosaminyl 1-phosphate transferase [Elizabethkingia meningoseptica]MDE5474958.1 undecaprenyl/decaprenyl-phosp
MKNFIELSLSGILSFTLAISIIPVMRIIAQKLKLVDIPNARKVHQTAIPLIGGLVIGIIVFLLMGISGYKSWKEILPVIIASYIMLFVGTLDDKTDINAKYKLAIQLCISILIATSGIRITSLYGLFGIYEIDVYFQYLLTILVITAAVNAFNLIDGIDGLAGSIAGIGFVLFFIIMLAEGNFGLAKIGLLFIGSIAAFLKYNLSIKNKIFLGNGGSLFLGYLLICLGIYITKFDKTTSGYPYGIFFILFVFTIPVIDSARVYTDRILRGKSPLKADKSHIHHHLLQLGLSHKKITLTFVLINIITFIIQYLFFRNYSIYTSFISFFAFIFIFKIIKTMNLFITWKHNIKEMEKL